MATKLATTPEGIVCSCCGQDKPAYHFYSRLGKTFNVTRFFFVSPTFSVTQCWNCNGDYRCLGCGEIKVATEFRVGGRFRNDCKTAGIYETLAEAYAPKRTVASADSLDAENALESELDE